MPTKSCTSCHESFLQATTQANECYAVASLSELNSPAQSTGSSPPVVVLVGDAGSPLAELFSPVLYACLHQWCAPGASSP